MSEESKPQLDRIEGALTELSRHLLNTQTDVDDLKQAHHLIQGGFQSNVDAQVSIAKDLATLKERSVTTLALAGVVPAIVLAVGIIAVAGKVLTWIEASPAAMAVLGFGP